MPRPIQARARARLAALTRATEAVLRRTAPEDLTVGEIAAEAGVSTAYLYTRFDNKQDLLDSLIEEFEAGQRAKAARLLRTEDWEAVALDERLSRLAGQFLTAAKDHRGLMRAIFSRRVIHGMTDQQGGPSFGASRQVMEWLLECRDEISHDDPGDAVQLSLLVLFSTLQVGLFMDLPDSAHEAIARELVGMLTGYLREGGDSPAELIGGLDREHDR